MRDSRKSMSVAGVRTMTGRAWRYAAVGASVNAALYLAYLAIEAAGPAPQIAMTVTYICGVGLSYVFNHRWSFRSERRHGAAAARYFALYGAVYLGQLAGLTGLIRLGVHHAVAQAGLIGLAAIVIFLTLDRFVFQTAQAPVRQNSR